MPRERRPSRCSHCKNEGHNITRCDIHNLKINCALASGEKTILNIPYFKINTINNRNIENIVRLNLLYRGLLPFVIRYNYMITYNMENKQFVFEEQSASDIRKLNMMLPIKGPTECSDISIKTKKIYEEHLKYYKENTMWSSYIDLHDLIDIFNNNFIEVSTRLNNERIIREAERQRRMEEYRQRRELERAQTAQRDTEANTIINRRVLPIIRTDEIVADDCPICIETLGGTNKTILRCGHSLCTSCLLTQTLRGAALKSTSSCFCTICRAPYL